MPVPEARVYVPLPNGPGAVANTIYMVIGKVCIRAKLVPTFVVLNRQARCGTPKRGYGPRVPKKEIQSIARRELAILAQNLSTVSTVFTRSAPLLVGLLVVGSRQDIALYLLIFHK